MTENQAAGLCTTVILHGLVVGVLLLPKSWIDLGGLGGGCSSSDGGKPQLSDEVEMIEAQLAYLKEDAPKQPQKKRTQRRTEQKEGVSRDENKKVEPPKEDKKDKPPASWEDFKRDTEEEYDPDLEEGEIKPKAGGAWDGDKFGWADENKGHPYLRELAKQVEFDVPSLEQGAGHAQACVRLRADGTVMEQKVREKSGNTNIDRAADEALRKLEEKRKDPKDVQPVPAELIDITNKWLCFKLGL